MNSDSDLLVTGAEIPVLNDPLIFNPIDLFPSSDDVLSISRLVEQLSIDLNTQHLKIEVKKLKREKLRATIKHVKQESIPTQQMLDQIHSDNTINREQLGAISNTYASELAHLILVTHCCLSRFHQVLTSMIPRISMPFDEHEEVLELIFELLGPIHLFKSTSPISSVV